MSAAAAATASTAQHTATSHPAATHPAASSAPAHILITADTDFLSPHGKAFAESFDPVLRSFLDPTLTLQDVATRTGQSVLALVQYFNRPFVQDLIKLVIDTTKARAQMLADAGIHSVVKTQYLAIEECERLTREQPITESTPPTQLAARARIRDQARKAASTLLNFSRQPASRTAARVESRSASRPASPPSPRPAPTNPPAAAHPSDQPPSRAPAAAHTRASNTAPDLPQTIPRAA